MTTFLTVGALRREIGTIPLELQKELRPKLKGAAELVAADMRRRSSFSQRIPGAIKVSSSFGVKAGLTIYVEDSTAPHARVLERGNVGRRGSTFRHPVYGNTDVWTEQPTRPFFFPAIAAGQETVQRAVSEAIRKAL